MTMREIKFRGRCLKTNKWIYGFVLINRGETFIVQDGIADPFATPDDFKVDPETVGQFTGIKDINGKEIYEGDIVDSGYLFDRDAVRELVIYYVYCFDFQCIGNTKRYDLKYGDKEIVGNCFDNPELMDKELYEDTRML